MPFPSPPTVVNPATFVDRTAFNPFTLWLYKAVAEEQMQPKVRLRNGMIVPMSWYHAEDPTHEYFMHKDSAAGIYLTWHKDGHSFSDRMLDIMELVWWPGVDR